MPGSMLLWESEEMLVDEYEALIKRRNNRKLPWVSEPIEHFADLVIAIAHRRFDEESTSSPGRFDESRPAGGILESISGQR